MEVVSLGATKYLKTLLNGWNSFIPVDPINATAANTHFGTDVKYASTDNASISGFVVSQDGTVLDTVVFYS